MCTIPIKSNKRFGGSGVGGGSVLKAVSPVRVTYAWLADLATCSSTGTEGRTELSRANSVRETYWRLPVQERMHAEHGGEW